jgi:hypothetical protein
MRPCLDCGALSPATRCPAHQRQRQQQRNASPARDIYRGDWPAYSRQRREAQPWCSLCGSLSDLTVDHTTDMVVCRHCHRTERHGGVGRRSGPS